MDIGSLLMHDGEVVASVRHQLRVVPLTLWLIALAAAVAGVLVWALFARELSRATPVPVADVPTPNAIVWHRKVFQSERVFRVELAREARDYETWARNHRPAAALLASLAQRSPRGR